MGSLELLHGETVAVRVFLFLGSVNNISDYSIVWTSGFTTWHSGKVQRLPAFIVTITLLLLL